MKPRIRLRLVEPAARPLGPLTRAEKLAKAIAFLRARNRYVLDKGARKPQWGIPGDIPQEANPLLAKIEAMDKERK